MKLLRRLRLRWLCWRMGIPVSRFDAWVDALSLEALEVGRIPAHIAGPLTIMGALGAPRPTRRKFLKATQDHPASAGVNLVHLIRAMEATDAVVDGIRTNLVRHYKLGERLCDHHLQPCVEERLWEECA